MCIQEKRNITHNYTFFKKKVNKIQSWRHDRRIFIQREIAIYKLSSLIQKNMT